MHLPKYEVKSPLSTRISYVKSADFPGFFRENLAFYSLGDCNSPVRALIPIRRAAPTGELQPQKKEKAVFFRKKSEKSRISHTKLESKMATWQKKVEILEMAAKRSRSHLRRAIHFESG